MSLLRLENISVRYGSIQALKGVSLNVEEGEIITLIGANGAGKTTLMSAITGLVRVDKGKIYHETADITNADTRNLVKKGIILAPEGRQIFSKFSVMDNLLMGAYLRKTAEIPGALEEVLELFPVLKERIGQPGGTLSGGEQQMLAVARAMMGNPRILLLDEPSLGLAPLIIADIFRMIVRIRDLGTTIILVEQNARMALKISDRAYVLETGNIVAEGTAENLLNSPAVKEAYLGGL